MKVRTYKVIHCSSSEELERQINSLIQAGAELIGGVSISSHFESYENERKGYTESNSEYVFAQAVFL